MPKYAWPSPLLAYSWSEAEQIYGLCNCYDYILVRESPLIINATSMRCAPDLRVKLCCCPFLVLSDALGTTAMSSDGVASPFAFDDHPLVLRATRQEDNWVFVNSCASLASYVMRPGGFEFTASNAVLSSTMCMPVRMARHEISYYAHCRRGHVEKQLADCRFLLQDARAMCLYSAQTLELLKTFAF